MQCNRTLFISILCSVIPLEAHNDAKAQDGDYRNEEQQKVHIFTTGGTIDKDYPQLTSGYAFEFGETSAAERILKAHPNLGICCKFHSISKKDSLEITDDDREVLENAIFRILCSNYEMPRIVVTHGTDTMIETAKYIRNCLLERNQLFLNFEYVIAFTGATKPERFVDSDASFNVGCAVAATSCCKPGSVVICMNGNVIPVDECVRDEASGLFRRKQRRNEYEYYD